MQSPRAYLRISEALYELLYRYAPLTPSEYADSLLDYIIKHYDELRDSLDSISIDLLIMLSDNSKRVIVSKDKLLEIEKLLYAEGIANKTIFRVILQLLLYKALLSQIPSLE